MIFEHYLDKITLSKELEDECLKFAEECYPTNKGRYSTRNQSNKKKIKEDIVNGKLGEFAAYEFLIKQGFAPNNKPDLVIYKGNKKSWKADLVIDSTNVHVKTQAISSAKKYGLSWTFQYNSFSGSKGNQDKLISNPEGVLILTLVDGLDVYIMACLPSVSCVPRFLQEPKVEWLKAVKRVLYYKTLQESIKEKIFDTSLLLKKPSFFTKIKKFIGILLLTLAIFSGNVAHAQDSSNHICKPQSISLKKEVEDFITANSQKVISGLKKPYSSFVLRIQDVFFTENNKTAIVVCGLSLYRVKTATLFVVLSKTDQWIITNMSIRDDGILNYINFK